jgi:hypothetical protein
MAPKCNPPTNVQVDSSFFVRLMPAGRSFNLNRQAEQSEKHAVLRQSLEVILERPDCWRADSCVS